MGQRDGLNRRGGDFAEVFVEDRRLSSARRDDGRVEELVGRKSARGMGISTFHSLCVRILRRHIEKLGYKSNFVIYDDSEQLNVVKKILSHISSRDEKKDAYAVLALLSKIKNGALKASAYADESSVAMAKHIVSRYESALRACNAVDFDDLLLLTLRLFRENPEALEECRKRFRYVMVDEYQDTNAAQFDLVHMLTQEHRNLCVVGDDDQSIYGWRGAEIANLLDMEKHFNEVKVVKLEQNYRSTQNILRVEGAVVEHNTERKGKTLWTENHAGDVITCRRASSARSEASWVVWRIQEIRQENPDWRVAVLYRANFLSRNFEDVLREEGIPYTVVGSVGFFSRIRTEQPSFETAVKMSATRLSPTNSVVTAADFRVEGR